MFTASIDSTFDDGLKTGGDSMFVWDRAVPVGDEWNDRTHHFMLCIGYDDHDSTWLIYNSWGEKWGLKGLGKITYRTMDWTCSEAYIVRPGDIPPTPLVDTVATAARTKRSGSYKGKGRVEDLHQAHGVAWRFLPERDLDHSHVEFMDARSLQRIHVVSVRDGQPVSFYHEGDLYTFRAMGKALFSGASRYEVVLNSDDQRGYLDQVRERLDLLEDGVIGN